jgi:hypothetical protein
MGLPLRKRTPAERAQAESQATINRHLENSLVTTEPTLNDRLAHLLFTD